MIAGLNPYSAYKDSGVAWLGEVPAHWEVKRLKSLATNVVDHRSQRQEQEITLALDNVESWSGRYTDAGPDVTLDSQLKRFQSGDVLFGKLRPYLAKVACPDKSGVCVGEFLVLRSHSKNMIPGFLQKVLCSKPMIDTINASTFGAKMPRAEWQNIGGLLQLVPPLPEQAAMVRFLDYADRRIRRYIRAKQKLIALLEEQKQAIIHQAVTGQIDVRTGQPYPVYKPSGVEWLGNVPAHWQRRRLKALLKPVDRRSTTGEETLLSLRRDHGVVVYADHFAHPSQSGSLVGFKLIHAGQLVVNRLQANNGLIFASTLDGLVSPDYSVFDARLPVQMRFLSELCRTSPYRANFRRKSTGLGTGTAGFLRLYDDKLLDTLVFLPPPPEQAAILDFFERTAVASGRSIDGTCRQIDLLQEYRTRLIADVVTGKVDVRGVANVLSRVESLSAEEAES